MNNIDANSVGKIYKDIYIIKNDINDKIYIGQSVDTERRFKDHCKPSQNNSLIDKAINKYGKEHFWYEIIEHNITNYNERECYWISYYNSKHPNGYNLADGGSDAPILKGDDHPNVKISDEDVKLLKDDLKNTTLPLMSLAKKYNISKKQVLRINQGISRSQLDETYPIRTNPNRNGKLSEEDIDEIIELLKYSYRFNGDIAKEYGVEVHAINRINQGINYRRDNEEYPIRKWKSCGVILFTYEEVTEIMNDLLNSEESLRSIALKHNTNVRNIQTINNGSSKKYKRDDFQYPLRPYN